MGMRVHVIEDEKDIAKLIEINLKLEGHDVEIFKTGEAGLQAVKSNGPDLVLLDLMLPGIDGLEICKRIKSSDETKKIPVIIVTAKGEDEDIVKGLEMGADDYITKPFGPKVLTARVKTALRRKEELGENLNNVILGDLSIHVGRHEVKLKEQSLDLTPSEFQILLLLTKRPGWVFTRTQIVDAIRGDHYAVTDRTVDFQMVGLRKKLCEYGKYIETVRGIGYKFRDINN